MAKQTQTFEAYKWTAARECLRQFRGNTSFVIAARDAAVLESACAYDLKPLPGFEGMAFVARPKNSPSSYDELFIDPSASQHRKMQLAFYDHNGIYLPGNVARQLQSDHAFPVSASSPEIGLVRAQLIPQATNGAFGAMLEKFRQGRKGEIESKGYIVGTLLDLGKALGMPLFNNDFEEYGHVLIEQLIGSGIASETDRRWLTAAAEAIPLDIIGDS